MVKLSGNQLKIFAMIAMLCDHVGKILLPQYRFLRIIGRLAFPIFAYMIAEGCVYTKNRAKYLGLLFGFGMGCQVVYFIAERSLYQNILITFSLAVAVIFAIDRFREKKDIWALSVVLLAVFVSGILPELVPGFRVDYGIFGVMLPVAVYFMPGKRSKLLAAALVLAALAYSNSHLQWFALLSVPLLAFYSGERGRAKLKYLFYLFYPSHLAVLYLLDLVI